MLWYIQRYLILIEALNLVLEKIFSTNPAAWQYHSASLYTTEFYTEICHGLPLEIFTSHYELWIMNMLQLTVACSWAYLLKSLVWKALLSFNHSAKQARSHLSQANLGKIAIRAMLWHLGLCVMYYCNSCTLCLPHKWKHEKNGRVSGLESTASLGETHSSRRKSLAIHL